MQRSLKRAHSDSSCAKSKDELDGSTKDRAAQIADFKSFLKLAPQKETGEADDLRTCTTTDNTSDIKEVDDEPANSWGWTGSSQTGKSVPDEQAAPPTQEGSAATIAPTTDWNLSKIVGAVEADACGLMENHLGLPLTQENLSQFQEFLTDQAKMVQPQTETDERQLNKRDASYMKQLQDIKQTGKWQSKGGVGNKFRNLHAPGTAKGDEWAKLTDKRSQDKYRHEWSELELTHLQEKKTVVRCWSRVDKSTFKYRTFGRLVLDFGGWTDKAAVQGASTAALKCLALGEPWAKQHPQTEMVEFAIVELAWEDHFRFMFHTFSYVRAYVFLCTSIRFLM
jgi:hypothetical protein